MMKLRTKITLLICAVLAAILLINQYPITLSMKQSVRDAGGRALLDLTRLAALSPSAVEGVEECSPSVLRQLALELEHCANCTGAAIVDAAFQPLYNTPEDPIEPQILLEYRTAPLAEEEQHTVARDSGEWVTYAFCSVRNEEGQAVGHIITKLRHAQNHPDLQKVQRDLNAMTILVMLIALIFVWDLTDNIKGSMFNLEPVEIAQLLVERTALIDAVRDGILSVDSEGRLIHVNRAALELFQRELGDFDLKHGSFSDIFPHIPLPDILEEDHPRYDSECMIGPDSFYVNFIPIRIDKPRHESVLVTFRLKQEVVRFAEDITGVRSYIEALRAQMHEFNNKLQVMSGLVQARSYPELEEYIYNLVHLKNREMDQINRKIKDSILAAFLMSKFDRASEQKVDLVLTDRSDIHNALPENLVQDMVAIIGNLLENAFDAVQGRAMRTVTLELVETAGEISVSVWDSGTGIPAALREQIFDYGVTTKEEGHGIGLFLVHQAVRGYNGYVTLSSDPQDGTEFSVHIPWSKEQEERDVSVTDC